MSKSIYIYPFGEKWQTFDAMSGVTKEHARGVLNQGMTLRDHFAGLAMQGLSTIEGYVSVEHIAQASYQLADAMIAEREK